MVVLRFIFWTLTVKKFFNFCSCNLSKRLAPPPPPPPIVIVLRKTDKYKAGIWDSRKSIKCSWKSVKIFEKPMKIYENLWKSMKIYGNLRKCMKIYDFFWKSDIFILMTAKKEIVTTNTKSHLKYSSIELYSSLRNDVAWKDVKKQMSYGTTHEQRESYSFRHCFYP